MMKTNVHHFETTAVFLLLFVSSLSKINVTISRDHVGVWFNNTICYHGDKPPRSTTCSLADLSVMGKRIAEKFGRIMVDSPSPLHSFPPPLDSSLTVTTPESSLWIPSIIAEQNREGDGGKGSFSSVILSFQGGDNQSDTRGVDTAIMIANHANSIHPGTVSTLLLLQYSSSLGHAYEIEELAPKYRIQNVQVSLRAARRKMLQAGANYKLGVTIELSYCGEFRGGTDQVADEIKRSIPHLDVIVVFVVTRLDYDPTNDPAAAVIASKTLFEDCERRLKELKPELEVVPFVQCYPQKMLSLEEYFRCWGSWSEWAVRGRGRREVLLFEAVDEEYSRIGHGIGLEGSGWWRVEPRVPFQDSALVEKISDPNPGATTRRPFRPDLLTVNFDHRVRYTRETGETIYTKEELSSMLELVTQTFPSIMSPPAPHSKIFALDGNGSELVIPEMVAQLNKKKDKEAPGHNNSLSSIVTFSDAPNILDSIKAAKWVADQANKISPGTVTILMYRPWSESTPFYHQFKETPNNILEAKRFLDQNANNNGTTTPTPKYRLGAILPGLQCVTEERWRNYIRTVVLEHVDVLSVLFLNNNNDWLYWLDSAGEKDPMKRYFWTCQQSLLAEVIKPEVEVSPGIVCNGGSEVEIVECWQFASSWAEELGTRLIVFSAFDYPTFSARSGWWRLAHKGILHISKDSFVERIQEVTAGGGKSLNACDADVNETRIGNVEVTPGESDGMVFMWSPASAKIYLSLCCLLAGGVIALIATTVLLMNMSLVRKPVTSLKNPSEPGNLVLETQEQSQQRL